MLVAYAQEATQSPYGSQDSAASAAGFPSPAELVEAYARLSGSAVDDFGFYLGLAFFKIAGILEGIHFRYIAGQTVGDGFPASVPGCRGLSRPGWQRPPDDSHQGEPWISHSTSAPPSCANSSWPSWKSTSTRPSQP